MLVMDIGIPAIDREDMSLLLGHSPYALESMFRSKFIVFQILRDPQELVPQFQVSTSFILEVDPLLTRILVYTHLHKHAQQNSGSICKLRYIQSTEFIIYSCDSSLRYGEFKVPWDQRRSLCRSWLAF